jgi:hypothetical protein
LNSKSFALNKPCPYQSYRLSILMPEAKTAAPKNDDCIGQGGIRLHSPIIFNYSHFGALTVIRQLPLGFRVWFRTTSSAGGPSVLNQFPEEDDESLDEMAPAARRDLLHKDHFAFVFGGAKTQSYSDPAAKGPGSHTYV